MNKGIQISKIELDNEDFFNMLEVLNRVIGLESELPDRIILEWRNGEKIIFEFDGKDWYKIIEEE